VTGQWPGACGTYYRSGDQVRRRTEDGAIEFLGRLDDQFKLRGFRIEPGEVENVLAGNEQVRAAAVAVRLKEGAKQLVAWIVPAGDELNRRQLRKWLKERVPDHMVPNAFVTVEELPINANGKLDRKALPEPDWGSRSIYI
jgi:acyl-coenzyme A synthetase/AMP-(fatty) acid ligase